jgi:hypothetical protein
VAWPLWAAGLALLMGAILRAPTKPVSVVEIQAAYEIALMTGVFTRAAFVRASSTGSYRALLAGSSGGATRLGWIVIGPVSAWLAIVVLGTFLSAGDAKARDIPTSLRGWAAGRRLGADPLRADAAGRGASVAPGNLHRAGRRRGPGALTNVERSCSPRPCRA